MTPEQCRAARKLLGWSRERLEGESGICAATIMAFELQKRSTWPLTVTTLQRVLQTAGVEFTDGAIGPGCGRRMRDPCGYATGSASSIAPKIFVRQCAQKAASRASTHCGISLVAPATAYEVQPRRVVTSGGCPPRCVDRRHAVGNICLRMHVLWSTPTSSAPGGRS